MKLPFKVPKEISISIYHDPTLEESKMALKILKQCAIKNKFNVMLVQSRYVPPEPAIVADIVYFLGKGSVQKGISSILIPQAPVAKNLEELQNILNKSPSYLRKPLLVDWRHGRALIPGPPTQVIDFVKNIGVNRENNDEK